MDALSGVLVADPHAWTVFLHLHTYHNYKF